MPREHRASDVEVVRDQLGREPTTRFEVVVRCPIGHPLVIRDDPLDVRGEPFPTTFWLTCPDAVKAVSRLEADGAIRRLNERFADDADFRTAVERAHAEAAEERARMLPAAGAWGGVGGTRRGIKCLHAHYANHLAGGDDVVGAWVSERVEPIHPEHPIGERIAVVDQGTHSCRLLVVERAPDGALLELASDMVITKLGQGVDATGALDPEAVARNERVLARYVRRARALGVQTVRVTATSAVRDASNRDLYVASVRRACRHRPAGHRRGGGGAPVVPGRHVRAVGRRRPVPAAGYRRRVDGVRRGARAGASRAAGQHPDGLGPADRTCDRHRSARSRRAGGGPAIDRRAAGRGRARRPRDPHRAHVRRRVGHRHDDAGDRTRPRSIRPGRRSIGPGSRSPTPSGCSRTWRG